MATIDGAPVVAMIGDIPGYRDLSTSSTDGADIRQLELNLVQLGFDPDHKIVIDETYDSATKAAVTAWEDSLGLTGDGKITKGELVFIPGRLLVDTVSATVGGSVNAGSALVVGRQAERKYLVAGLAGATIDHQTRRRNQGRHRHGAVLEQRLPGDRDRGRRHGDTRPDERPVRRRLRRRRREALRAGAGRARLRRRLDDDDRRSLRRRDGNRGRSVVGIARNHRRPGHTRRPCRLVRRRAGRPLGRHRTDADGTVLAGDSVVLSLTAPSRQVTTTAPIGDDTFALGAKIDVEFPDGTVQPGTVVDVGNVATNTTGTPGDTPTVTITIGVDNIPATVDSFVEIPVTLRVVSASVPNAIVVPVSALVALKEGGYAVQVVTGANPDGTNQTTLVGVTPGLFTNGFVQVDGDLKADLDVVVPS